MLFWKILLQVLAVAIALLVNRLDYVTHDKRTRKFKIGRRLLFLLSIIFLGASIIVVVKDESAKNTEVKNIIGQLNTLKQQAETTQKSITGGDNFCYINLVPDGSGENSPVLIAINDGDYPLSGISVRMWDPADYGEKAIPMKSLEEFIKDSHIIDVGDLNPHSAKTLGHLSLPKSELKNFEITLMAKNGVFTQQLRLRRIDGVWKRAFRVSKGHEVTASNILLERADMGFPRDNMGRIQW